MMRVPVYIVCAAIIVAVNSEDNYYGRQQALFAGSSRPDQQQEQQHQQQQQQEQEQEALGYILPRLMMAKYRPYKQWNTLPAPASYYPLAEFDANNIDAQMEAASQEDRDKRAGLFEPNGPSLSISNSLDVLRNRLLANIYRKKELEGAHLNRNILCKIGKRGAALFGIKRQCEEPEKYVNDKLGEK